MRVGIITQPLETNYGGLLQNYALQQTLIKMGHDPITFDQFIWYPPFAIRLKVAIKGLATAIQRRRIKRFLAKHIKATPKAVHMEDFKKFEERYRPDAYIVGSDQVWRPLYNRLLDASFLTFTAKRKIAYAASIGTDEWEFTPEQTKRYATYIKDFDAISVRELSAVKLCKDFFEVDATLVLDPTLLLTAEEYSPLLCDLQSQDHVFTYILDSEDWKKEIVRQVCTQEETNEMSGHYDCNVNKTRVLSVEEWLTGLKQSKFVVCDSFHGTVFSLLMHRPFIVLGNHLRGNTRLLSMLEAVGLKDRLVIKGGVADLSSLPGIDWSDVDKRLSVFRSKSILFLQEALA